MISKKLKVERNQIDYILEKGESTSSRLFIIRYKENDQQISRFCVIISRKIDKSAVNRNRLRRQVFEIIRTEDLSTKLGSLDIVLIPKKSITEKDFDALKDDLIDLRKILKQKNE